MNTTIKYLTHACIIVGCALAACDSDQLRDDHGATATQGALESAGAGDGADRSWVIPATSATRSAFGVYQWHATARTNGTFVFNGLRSNGTTKFWQAWYASGGGGNPWNIHESESTFLAVRSDASESYVEPNYDDPAWQLVEAVRDAFESDLRAYFGRVIVAGGAAAAPLQEVDHEAADAGGDCESANYQAKLASVSFEMAIAIQRATCAVASQGGKAELLACANDTKLAVDAGMDYVDSLTDARDICADEAASSPPSGYIPPPPPPPGGSGGGCNGCGSSGQSWEDGDTSSSEWYFNSWRLRCMNTSVTVCSPECTTWYETECWWEQQ